MNTINEIQTKIDRNISLLVNISSLTNKVNIVDLDIRDMLLAGFFRNCLTHFEAMNVLIEKKLYNSAFALVRAFFETIVRARFMYIYFDDEEINKLYIATDWEKIFKIKRKDQERNLGIMCKALDTHYNSTMFIEVKERAYKIMCDYTHTGANQIAHNFNEDTGSIEPNFAPELIIDTLNGNCTLMKSFAILYFEIGLNVGNISPEEMEYFISHN